MATNNKNIWRRTFQNCYTEKWKLLNLMLILCFTSYQVTAQEGAVGQVLQKDTTDLPSEQLEVIKAYEAKLAEARRLNINPKLPKPNTTPRNYDYNVTIVPVEIEYPNPVIRPLAMKPGNIDPFYKAWARIGYSTLQSPYVHGGYTLNSDDDYHISATYLHQGGKDEDPILRKYYRNQLIINGDYQLADFEVYTQIEGNLLTRYQYGIDTIGDFDLDQYKRSVNNFSFKAGIRDNAINDSDLHYDISPFVSLTSINAFDTKEINTGVEVSSIKKVGDHNSFKLDLDLLYASVNQDNVEGNFTADFTPQFLLRKDELSVDAGIDYIFGNGTSYIWPQARIQYDISGEKLGVMIGSDQNHKLNNYKNLSQLNHFIRPAIDSISNQVEQNIYAGAKGNLFNTLQYEGKIGYRKTQNMAIFNNSFYVLPGEFDMSIRDVNAVFIEGYVGYQLFEWLKVDGQVSHQFFDRGDDDIPIWYVPAFELDAGATLTGNENKYRVHAMLSLASKTDFFDLEFVSQTNAQYELSIDGEYFFTENIGIFLQANNLLNNQYERWDRYPRYGIHLVGGASVKF